MKPQPFTIFSSTLVSLNAFYCLGKKYIMSDVIVFELPNYLWLNHESYSQTVIKVMNKPQKKEN